MTETSTEAERLANLKVDSPCGGIDDLHASFEGEDHFTRLLPRPLLKMLILMYADIENDRWPLPEGQALREMLGMLFRHILGAERLLVPALSKRDALRFVGGHAATYKLSGETLDENREIANFMQNLHKETQA